MWTCLQSLRILSNNIQSVFHQSESIIIIKSKIGLFCYIVISFSVVFPKYTAVFLAGLERGGGSTVLRLTLLLELKVLSPWKPNLGVN